jgi:hypothetical protein
MPLPSPRRFVFVVSFVVIVLLLIIGFSSILAQQSDGRINQTAHFGGDALYCLDGNYQVTVQYPSSEGGFRLLNRNGQELWFVSYTEVAAALEIATPGGAPVLVASGWGTYGPSEIYTFEVGKEDVYFTYTGYDEHGKPNSLTFKFCIPVYGASVQVAVSTDVPPTSVVPTNTALISTPVPPTQTPTVEITPEVTQEQQFCFDDVNQTEVLCSECPSGQWEEMEWGDLFCTIDPTQVTCYDMQTDTEYTCSECPSGDWYNDGGLFCRPFEG